MSPIIPTVIGVAASITYPLSYVLKKRRDIILLNAFARALYILQYLLLGAFSGAVLDLLGAIACVIAEKKDTPFIKKHLTVIIIAVNAVIVIAGLTVCYFEKSALGLLTIAGVLIHTGAFWLTSERTIRIVSLVGSPFWFSYNLISKAYGSLVGDVLTVSSIIAAMIKYRDKKENPTPVSDGSELEKVSASQDL